MQLLHNKVLLTISSIVEKAIKKSYPKASIELSQIYNLIGEPPNSKMGHFAFPCFQLAKLCKTSPNMIAANISKATTPHEIIKSQKEAGPYLNIFLNTDKVCEIICSDIIDETFFNQNLTDSPKKIMFEYSQPNTHKELHVGHMRNLCLGNAVAQIYKYVGHDVVTATYPGDVGTHVAKCLWYLKNKNKSPIPEKEKGAWLGKIYALASKQFEKDDHRQELTNILKELESESGEYFETWKETRKWSIDLMKQVYEWANIEFDRWFFESEVDAPSIKRIKKYYQDGIFIKSDGAIGMNLEEENLGFCMMIKSDGNGMYATKDIDLAYRKFEKYGLDKSVYIVDVRQTLHFKQVFKVLEKIGFKHANDCSHLQYDLVELPEGALASRKGNIIPMTDLIRKMEATIKNNYLNRYQGEWDENEINQTASMIANGAIKYGMINIDNNRKIIFRMDEWLKLDGETGPYLQYVYARINSLCNKLEYNNKNMVNWQLLTTPQEEALIIKLSTFNDAVSIAGEQYKTNFLCSYLYELGKLFNSFYAECSIGKAGSNDLKNTRMALAFSTGAVIKKGLELLGIPTPDRM